MDSLQPGFGSNITRELRRIAILCGTSWPFRQAQAVLKELIGVSISFGHIRWLCSDEAETVVTQGNEKYKQVEFQALVETMEVLVEYLADEPNETTKVPMSRSGESDSSTKQIYIGIDGTFINALVAERFFEAKAGIVFTDERIQVSKGRNLLLNKQYVGSCQSVKEFSESYFAAQQIWASMIRRN